MNKQFHIRLSPKSIQILDKLQKDWDLSSRNEVLKIIIRDYYSNAQLKQDISEIKKKLGSE